MRGGGVVKGRKGRWIVEFRLAGRGGAGLVVGAAMM